MDIETIVKEFPAEIPGAKYVDRYFLRGSSLVFVHIRQRHRVKEWPDSFYERLAATDKELADIVRSRSKRRTQNENVELTWKVQSDIYDILSFLTDHYGVNDVYCEGVTDILIKLYDRYFFINEEENKDDAYMRLFAEGRINLKAAETLHTNSMGAAYLDLGYDNVPQVIDLREQECLEIVAEQEQSMAFVIYGANHDFYPDIKQWNKSHDRKLSLVAITPESYPEDRGLFSKVYQKVVRGRIS